MKLATDTHGHTQNFDVIDALPQSRCEEVTLSVFVCVGLWLIRELKWTRFSS
jgi:hypothetical protein